MELERRTSVASTLERVRERERLSARESRARAVEAIYQANAESAGAVKGNAEDQNRLREAEWRSAESFTGRERQMVPLVRAAERHAAEGCEEFLERRKERRQVERVLESAAERERVERERREQRELDDWFGMKQARQARDE